MKLIVDMNLSHTHGERPNIVQIRADDISPDMIGLRVISALQQMETALEVGALWPLNRIATVYACFP